MDPNSFRTVTTGGTVSSVEIDITTGTLPTDRMAGSQSHAGVAAPLAAGGILAYRLVAYALVAAAGWVVWAALRRRPRSAVAPQ